MKREPRKTQEPTVQVRIFFAGELIVEGKMAGQIVEMGKGK